MTFQESIIIPLSLFKKCQIEETIRANIGTSEQILQNPTLHSAEKIKLYNQAKLLEQKNRADAVISPEVSRRVSENETDTFLHGIPEKYKPYGKSIVEFIRKHPNEVGWDELHRIRVKGFVIPDSNLGESLKHFMKNTVVTKDSDIPPGTQMLQETLFDLGIPKSWFPVKYPTRTGRKRPRMDMDKTIKWDSY